MNGKKKLLISVFVRILTAAVMLGLLTVPKVQRVVAMSSVGILLPKGTVNLLQNYLQSERAEQPEQTPDVADLPMVAPEDIAQLSLQYAEKAKKWTKAGTIDRRDYSAYQYTHRYEKVYVKNTTDTFQQLDIGAELAKDSPFVAQNTEEPTVLLFHSHSTEGYQLTGGDILYKEYNDRTEQIDRNIVRVGTEMAKVLAQNGIGVIHDTRIYDENYSAAYENSRKSVLAYLQKYPTIATVIDVHRDSIHPSDSRWIAPTVQIEGKSAAQIMIITGIEEGKAENFPRWEQNLRFALALQKTAAESYEGLMRPVLFSPRKYNMDTSPCGILLEMGSDGNTLEEAVYAGRLMGQVLSKMILQGAKESVQ